MTTTQDTVSSDREEPSMIRPRRAHRVEHLYSLGSDAWAARCRCREAFVARGQGARQRVLADARAHAATDGPDLAAASEHVATTTARRPAPTPHRFVAAFARLLFPS